MPVPAPQEKAEEPAAVEAVRKEPVEAACKLRLLVEAEAQCGDALQPVEAAAEAQHGEPRDKSEVPVLGESAPP